MKGGRDETRQHNARASSLFSSFVNCAAVYIYYATKGSHCLQVFIAKHCRCLFVALALAFLLFPVLLSDFIHESLEFNDPSLPFHWRKAIEWKLGELASNYNALSASLSMLVLYQSQATKLYTIAISIRILVVAVIVAILLAWSCWYWQIKACECASLLGDCQLVPRARLTTTINSW